MRMKSPALTKLDQPLEQRIADTEYSVTLTHVGVDDSGARWGEFGISNGTVLATSRMQFADSTARYHLVQDAVPLAPDLKDYIPRIKQIISQFGVAVDQHGIGDAGEQVVD